MDDGLTSGLMVPLTIVPLLDLKVEISQDQLNLPGLHTPNEAEKFS